MNRIVIAIALLGGLISYNGAQELERAGGMTREPLRVSLSDLEAGRVPVNPHLRIGKHWAMHHELVFSYAADPEDPNAELDAVYYPIVATDNAYFRELDYLEARYRGRDNVPPSRVPELDRFSVLVRTERYETIDSLPDPDWAMTASVTGLIANRARPLTAEEIRLVESTFPEIDPLMLLVLEEGRRPVSVGQSFAQIGGGALLALSPFAMFAIRSRRHAHQSALGSSSAESPDSPDSASDRACSAASASRNV